MNLEINNKENPLEDFNRIADELINGSFLLVGDNEYRFTTVEFYYLNKDNKHVDVYSHKHNYQKEYGKWYFHGSGLDITFGQEDVYGGILIRGIQNFDSGEFINGPLLCVQEIFKSFGDVENGKKVSFCVKALNDKLRFEPEKIYQAPRVGLNPSKDKLENLRFYNALYRFFINPQKTQKDKSNIAEHLLKQVKIEEDFTAEILVNKLFGYKHFKE